VEHGSMR